MDWFSADGYWLSRLVFQRALALVYVAAFLSTALQFRALIGEHGLLPVPDFVRRVPFRRAPSLFQLHYSDRFFAAAAWVGVVVSIGLLVGAADDVPLWGSMLIWTVPWVLHVSIVNVGQTWWGFVWESLLCEVGCYAIFLGPSSVAPPRLVLLSLLWVLFRLELGAGLIKIRHDSCWRDLTCLLYHHETQPTPGPFSWHFHHLPALAHRLEVVGNHVAQLIVPFLLFAPQPVRGAAGALVILTQGWLLLSGNFAWLNLLAIALASTAVDDDAWAALLPVRPPGTQAVSPTWHQAMVAALAVLVAVLSYWPVRNLLSRDQVMNRSYNSLHVVNTYGLFGSITRVRREIVLEGTDEPDPGPDTVWREYAFKAKPGDVRRRPRQVAPYHLRLDWMMWFAALSPGYAERWFVALVFRLLRNDAATLKLLRHNPFPDRPPACIRARYYRYRYTTRRQRRETGAWWDRRLVGEYLQPLALTATRDDRSRAA